MAYCQFQHGVVTEKVAIVCILIACRNLENALFDLIGQRMYDKHWVTPVFYLAGQLI
jgi:hypothetical protein